MDIKTVTERVAEYIKVQIITGKILPGERINEMSLASHLNVSTAPLREALNILQNENLVDKTPRKGTRVTAVSYEDCEKLCKIREILEFAAIDFLKDKPAQELSKVVSAFESVSPVLSMDLTDEKVERILETHNPFPDFHIAMVESTNNPYLIQMYRSICPTLARYQFMAFKSVSHEDLQTRLETNQKEHSLILDYIRHGDYEQAKKVMKSHIYSLLEGNVSTRNGTLKSSFQGKQSLF